MHKEKQVLYRTFSRFQGVVILFFTPTALPPNNLKAFYKTYCIKSHRPSVRQVCIIPNLQIFCLVSQDKPVTQSRLEKWNLRIPSPHCNHHARERKNSSEKYPDNVYFSISHIVWEIRVITSQWYGIEDLLY